jgi:WD40 repeat protein
MRILDPSSSGKVFRCSQCGKVFRVSAAHGGNPSPARHNQTTRPAAAREEPPAADPFAFGDAVGARRFPRPSARRQRRGVGPVLIAGLVGGAVLLLLLVAGVGVFALSRLFRGQQPVAPAPATPRPPAAAPAPTRPAEPEAKPRPADTAPAPAEAPRPAPRELLLGRWESQDGEGTLAFDKDGSVTLAMAGAPEQKGTYQFLNEDIIKVSLPLPGGGSADQKLKVQVGKDELVTTDESNKVDRFKRAATARAPAAPPKAAERPHAPESRPAAEAPPPQPARPAQAHPALAAAKEPRRTFKGHLGLVRAVTVSPDGKTLASGGNDQTIRLWDLATGKPRATLKGHTAGVRALAFSPDGRLLASATAGFDQAGKQARAEVKLWDAAAGKLRANLKWSAGPGHCLAFSPDGKLVAVGGSALDAEGTTRGAIWLWEVSTGKQRPVLKQPVGGDVVGVAFTPDGKTLVAASRRKGLHLWDVSRGTPIGNFINLERTVYCLALSPDGKTAAVGLGGRDEMNQSARPGEVVLWDLAGGKTRTVLGPQAGSVWCVAFAPDGRAVASGTADDQSEPGGPPRGETYLWDAATGRELGSLLGDVSGVAAVTFTPDGKGLVTAGYSEAINLWDVSKMVEQQGGK